MLLLEALPVPPPDQIAELIRTLGSGGPAVVLVGIWMFFTLRKDKGEGEGAEALMQTMAALREQLADVVNRLKALEAERDARQRAAERASERAALVEELRGSRVTGELVAVPREKELPR